MYRIQVVKQAMHIAVKSMFCSKSSLHKYNVYIVAQYCLQGIRHREGELKMAELERWVRDKLYDIVGKFTSISFSI